MPVPLAQAVEPGELGLPETPFMVPPKVRTADHYRRLLAEAYLPLLRDGGITGAATLLLAVSEEGRVLDRRVHESSGDESLDQAALQVGQALEFTPASNEGVPVPVWITLEILFDSRAAPGRVERRVIRY